MTRPRMVLLALVASLLWACGGGDEESSPAADTGDTGPADAGGDATDDTPAEAGDPQDEATEDVSDDVIDDGPDDPIDDGDPTDEPETDPIDDPRSDLPADLFPEGDLPPYDHCPYSEASATGDCATLCTTVAGCRGDETECQQGCANLLMLWTQEAFTGFQECVAMTDCGSVDAESDLGEHCLFQTLSSLTGNATINETCQDVDERVDLCAGSDTPFQPTCAFIGPALRPEALSELDGCANANCIQISDCTSAAVCDLL